MEIGVFLKTLEILESKSVTFRQTCNEKRGGTTRGHRWRQIVIDRASPPTRGLENGLLGPVVGEPIVRE